MKTKKKLHRPFSLKQYMILVLSSLIIITTLILLIFPTKLYEELYYQQTENYCKNMIIQTCTGISDALDNFDNEIDQMSDDRAMREILSNRSDRQKQIYDYQKMVAQYFPPQSMDGYYLKGLDLYLKDGGTHLQYGLVSTQLDSPFDSDYFREALVAPHSANWVNYDSEDSIRISRVLYDYDSYEILGLLIISLSTEYLLDKFSTYNTIEVEHLYMINQAGVILCSNDNGLLGDTYALPKNDTAGKLGAFQDSNKLTVYCQLGEVTFTYPYQKWTAVIEVNKDILLRDFRMIQQLFYLIALLIIAFGIIVIIRFTRSVTKPIEAVVSGMKQVQEGDLSVSLPEATSIREISFVNHGFNDMVSHLDNLINTIYKSELLQKETQLRLLQSQINPHFLFNTMQLISWKANEYEAYPICDMVQSLCYMLETNLSYRYENIFTLREELEYIHHYANIVHYKYLDKIQIELHVPEELLNCRLPVLIFQPFLENSIAHGLEPKNGPGRVSLTVLRENDNLIAVIEDNGVGIRKEILQLLKDTKGGRENNISKSSHHIALQNIQSRIKLLYGDSYGYTFDSRLYQGTKVTVTIPYQIS